MNLYHDSHDLSFREPFGAAVSGSRVRLAIRADGAREVFLRVWSAASGEQLIKMEPDYGMFRTVIRLPKETGLVWYYFVIHTYDGGTVYYGNNEDSLGGIGQLYSEKPEFSFQITVYDYSPVPDWYKEAVFYQIFPDRFAKAEGEDPQLIDTKIPGAPARRMVSWDKAPDYEKDKKGEILVWDFYGGTLRGIIEKLDYIKSLGVTGIYLNPIFEAWSNHRYDTLDYMKIDPLLGTEEDFRELCAKAEECGISIILDGVFNHCGIYSSYVKDHPEWFTLKEDGTYESWWGVRDLPEINELDPEYEEFICGRDGVVRKWIRAGAKGFRLDVADELPDAFIVKIREALKSEDPDAVLMGEVWEDASNKFSHGEQRKYFYGNELDCVMNYPLRDALLSFANGEEPSVMTLRRIMSLKENYPKENFMADFNLIDSHDRARVLTRLDCSDKPEKAKKMLMLLSTLLYALPGVPVIYYGDEAGMKGGADPENRGAYPWGHEDEELIRHYRLLGKLYGQHDVLIDGDFIPLLAGDDILAFERCDSGRMMLVLANRSDEELLYEKEYPGCVSATNVLTGKSVELNGDRVSAHIPPCSVLMIRIRVQEIEGITV